MTIVRLQFKRDVADFEMIQYASPGEHEDIRLLVVNVCEYDVVRWGRVLSSKMLRYEEPKNQKRYLSDLLESGN